MKKESFDDQYDDEMALENIYGAEFHATMEDFFMKFAKFENRSHQSTSQHASL
jgi:hypothetical protein